MRRGPDRVRSMFRNSIILSYTLRSILYVQEHTRKKYQTVHVSGPLVRLAAVLHRRRVLSCNNIRSALTTMQRQ